MVNENKKIAANLTADMLVGSFRPFIGLSFIFVCYVLLLTFGGDSSLRLTNALLPVLVSIFCLFKVLNLIQVDSRILLTFLPWFLFSWSLYYAFGPMVYVFGSEESITYMNILYALSEYELARTNLLNLVGLISVFLGVAIATKIRFNKFQKDIVKQGHSAWRVAIVFLLIGVPIKYFYELPYVLGLLDYVLPGAIQHLGSFTGLAIIPLMLAASEGKIRAKYLLWFLVVTEFIVGLMMLAKLHIIKTIIIILIGALLKNVAPKRILITGILVGVIYVTFLTPFVNFARFSLDRGSAQNISQVINISGEYGDSGRDTLAILLPGVQAWWTRLAYSNVQGFAMNQYDQGISGRTFDNIPYVFVPRLLDSDKPYMSPGIEFTMLIQGTDNSSTGLGFIAEAYWNGGWFYVFLTGLFVGGLFVLLSRISIYAIRSRLWLYTPVIYNTIFLALRPDDWFVLSYVGGTLQILVTIVLLNLIAGRFVKLKD